MANRRWRPDGWVCCVPVRSLPHSLTACHAHQLISRCGRGGDGRGACEVAWRGPDRDPAPTAPRAPPHFLSPGKIPSLPSTARRASPSPAWRRCVSHGIVGMAEGEGRHGHFHRLALLARRPRERGNRIAPGLKNGCVELDRISPPHGSSNGAPVVDPIFPLPPLLAPPPPCTPSVSRNQKGVGHAWHDGYLLVNVLWIHLLG
ncbi:hypothetical protein SEVIR_3G121050v4 [Setaria viridis]